MKTLKFLLALLTLLSLSFPQKAARAGFEAENVEIFVPTSAWLVGSATLLPVSDAGFSMPCVMINQYNNGYVLRFSGGNGSIMAMAVDFRQNSFKPGTDYKVKIDIPPHFSQDVTATAHNQGTILVNVPPHADFYNSLQSGKYLYLTIGDKEFNFALLGAKNGLLRVEQCYNPQQQNTDNKSRGFQNATNHNQREAIPPVYSDALRQQQPPPVVEDKDKILIPMPGDLSKAQPSSVPGNIVQEMAALDNMLQSAAQKLAALEPASGYMKAGEIEKMATQKTNIPAKQAAKAMGKPLANSWTSPLNNNIAGLNQQDIIVAGHGLTATRERRWRAMQGNNLHEILDVWARHENVRLIWKTDHAFAIQESVSMQSTFEDAVLTVLQQHDKRKRPVGRIYIDPVVNQRVLLVETQEGS